MADKRLKTRLRDLEHAQDYASWHEIAEELDRLEGLDAWRADDASDDYDYLLIKERLAEMRALRSAGEVRHLAFALHEGDQLWLRAMVADPDGSNPRYGERRTSWPADFAEAEREAERAGVDLGRELR